MNAEVKYRMLQEAKADAWDEGVKAGHDCVGAAQSDHCKNITNPYRPTPTTEEVRMTTSPTHLSGHAHGEEAVEIVARALHVLLELEDRWDSLAKGDRDAYREMARVSVESLTTAGLLATEQEWEYGVTYMDAGELRTEWGYRSAPELDEDGEVELGLHEYVTPTAIVRRRTSEIETVTAWREQA